MVYLKAIFTLLQYVPEIVAAIRRGVEFIEVRIQLGKFDKAAESAKETKDTRELEEIFHHVPDPSKPAPPRD